MKHVKPCLVDTEAKEECNPYKTVLSVSRIEEWIVNCKEHGFMNTHSMLSDVIEHMKKWVILPRVVKVSIALERDAVKLSIGILSAVRAENDPDGDRSNRSHNTGMGPGLTYDYKSRPTRGGFMGAYIEHLTLNSDPYGAAKLSTKTSSKAGSHELKLKKFVATNVTTNVRDLCLYLQKSESGGIIDGLNDAFSTTFGLRFPQCETFKMAFKDAFRPDAESTEEPGWFSPDRSIRHVSLEGVNIDCLASMICVIIEMSTGWALDAALETLSQCILNMTGLDIRKPTEPRITPVIDTFRLAYHGIMCLSPEKHFKPNDRNNIIGRHLAMILQSYYADEPVGAGWRGPLWATNAAGKYVLLEHA